MLLESEVVSAVCAKLTSEGYEIRQRRDTTQRGDDIVAVRHIGFTRELRIEAKGESSSRQTSERYGKPFDRAQIQINISEGLYKAAEMLSRTRESVDTRFGIALPATETHRAIVKKIQPVLNRLEIAIFWVQKDRTVQIESTWTL